MRIRGIPCSAVARSDRAVAVCAAMRVTFRCDLLARQRADVSLDRVQQFVLREGLRQVVLGAEDAAAGAVEQAVLARQHDDRDRAEDLVVLDQRARLVTVQPRHHDVDEDDVRLVVGDLGERVEAVDGGKDLTTLFRQQRLARPAYGLAVVDDQHLQAGEAGWGARCEFLPRCLTGLRGRFWSSGLSSRTTTLSLGITALARMLCTLDAPRAQRGGIFNILVMGPPLSACLYYEARHTGFAQRFPCDLRR